MSTCWFAWLLRWSAKSVLTSPKSHSTHGEHWTTWHVKRLISSNSPRANVAPRVILLFFFFFLLFLFQYLFYAANFCLHSRGQAVFTVITCQIPSVWRLIDALKKEGVTATRKKTGYQKRILVEPNNNHQTVFAHYNPDDKWDFFRELPCNMHTRGVPRKLSRNMNPFRVIVLFDCLIYIEWRC